MKAKNMPTSFNQAVDPASLAMKSPRELDELFAALPPAQADALQGTLHGRLAATVGLASLPPVIRKRVFALTHAEFFPWRGKSFSGDRGANVWVSAKRGIRFAAYSMRVEAAHDRSGPVLRLDYDVKENLAPLRRILGEVRTLGPGLYLGRMYYRIGGRAVRVLYFTLSA